VTEAGHALWMFVVQRGVWPARQPKKIEKRALRLRANR
jgi:hypothetical protein